MGVAAAGRRRARRRRADADGHARRRAAAGAAAGARPGVLHGDRGSRSRTSSTPTWPSWSATSWATAACTPRASGSVSPTPTSTSSSGSRILSKELFGLEPGVAQARATTRSPCTSVRLARWWQAAGFAKPLPAMDHDGQGMDPADPVGDPRDQRRRRSTPRSCAGCSRPTARSSMRVPTLSTASRDVRRRDPHRAARARAGDDDARDGQRVGWSDLPGPAAQPRARDRPSTR